MWLRVFFWSALQAFVLTGPMVARAQEASDKAVEISGAQVHFAAISRSFIDRLFDALRNRSAFIPLPVVTSQVVDANTSGMWAGTKSDVETAVSSIELRFRPTAEARLERARGAGTTGAVTLAEEFIFTISTTPRGLHFRFPLAADPYFRNGLTAELSPQKRTPARTEFLYAAREAGMYLSMPAMIRSELDSAWGVLICPRVAERLIDSRGATAGYQLRRSPYELSEVKASWVASVLASIPLGSKRERVRVEHALSPDIPPGVEQQDEVVTVSPSVTLEYQPTAPFEFVRVPPDGQFRQGMVHTIQMQNASGYLRTQRFSHVAYVARVDEPSPVAVILRDKVAQKDEGECYIVGAQRSIWSEYDKQLK
jgi:hypothetical protein